MVAKVWFTAQLYRPTIGRRSSCVAGRIANVLAPFAMRIIMRAGDNGAVKPLIQTPLPGPKAAELIARDARAMSPSFTRAYPFVMERGEGCWVTDVDGNRFLDFTAGIAVVTTGHSHPKVVAAIEEQARRFIHP